MGFNPNKSDGFGGERERDGLLSFEREEKQEEIWGWGSYGRQWEEKKTEKKWNWLCVVIYGFICKMFMWHPQIGGCKTLVLHAILIEFNLKRNRQEDGGGLMERKWRQMGIRELMGVIRWVSEWTAGWMV